jgi:hypothetical protein
VGVAHYLDAADLLNVTGASREVAGNVVAPFFQVFGVDQMDGGRVARAHTGTDEGIFFEAAVCGLRRDL